MPKLTAISPIQHNGEDFAVGKVFTVKSTVEAQALVDAGVAVSGELVDAAAEEAAAAKAAAEAADKAAADKAAEEAAGKAE